MARELKKGQFIDGNIMKKVEEMNATGEKGVIKTPLSYNSWTHWLKIPYITYIEEETTSEPTTEIL